MNPRPESRISSLENRSATIEATLLELSNDTAEELKAIRQKQQDLFTHVQNGFDQAHSYITQEIETRLDTMATKKDLEAMEGRMNENIAGMATKDDISRLETDITEIKGLLQQLIQQKGGNE